MQRESSPKYIKNLLSVDISFSLLIQLHLITLLSKNANKKLFFYPRIQAPFGLKFKSVYPPNTLPSIAFTIVTVFSLLQHLF